MPTFPNVPNVPGVPPLRRDPLAQIATFALLAADVLGLLGSNGGPQWGVFLNGVPVISADSVLSFDYKQTWYVSDYPLEEGAFESYDKVQTPFDARIRIVAGGSQENRQAFLDSVAAIAGTLEFYDVVTPEVVYRSVNVTHYDYKRTATNGVGLVVVDLWLTQLRVTTQTAFSSTKSPSGSSSVNGGTVQPQTPASAELGSLAEVT